MSFTGLRRARITFEMLHVKATSIARSSAPR